MDIQGVVEFLIRAGAVWVRVQRGVHRPTARPLTEQERQGFVGFFEPGTLEAARVKQVAVIPTPEFYDQLADLGFQNPLDFTQMAGITFVDTILVSAGHTPPDTSRDSLLFHELVHVVQYETLGVEEFLRRYVQGWAQNGFRYEQIPLERDAYDLQRRYDAHPQEPFAVRAEVRGRLGVSL